MAPDLATLRRVPWHPGTAMVQCRRAPGSTVRRRRVAPADPAAPARPARRGRDGGVRRHRAGVHRLQRHLRAGVAVGLPRHDPGQPLQRRLLDLGTVPGGAAAARHPAGDGPAPACGRESAKGECNFGQHEIAFRYERGARDLRQPRRLQDRRQGDRRAGAACRSRSWPSTTSGRATPATSTCRSAGLDGSLVHGVRRRRRSTACPALGRSFIAGQLAHLRELSLLFAPNINSYKRFARRARSRRPRSSGVGTTAPARCAWSAAASGLRLENRVPGGDVNPYLAVAAMVAAGLDGIERGLELEPAFPGNAYASDAATVPWTRWPMPLELWEGSRVGRRAPSATRSQDHYTNMARVELGGVRPRRHRLGAVPRLRAALTPRLRPDRSVRTHVGQVLTEAVCTRTRRCRSVTT